jgi:hypothetical protein
LHSSERFSPQTRGLAPHLLPTTLAAEAHAHTTPLANGVHGHDADDQQRFARVRALDGVKGEVLILVQEGV